MGPDYVIVGYCSISSPEAVVWVLLWYRNESVTLVVFVWTENSSVASG